jgi:hypothetical protein
MKYTIDQFQKDLDQPYAWPGGYPRYFITSDGAALSFESARHNIDAVIDSIKENLDDGWQIVACDVNWEDADLYCEDTGKRIESAYSES